eukprot:TRINITY_DN2750_c0_g2_i1.p2 TRINITY_DN2750_c0_g2~~TRINITY_DN2750_c0_g2_i1.p2  ORF type:complete len:425 (-),score=151.44 TRINITY_DN2750_c0_g2_i1:71-1345(-)
MAEENTKKGAAPSPAQAKKPKTRSGYDDNREMPDFIAKAPWYVSQGSQNLDHQKFKAETSGDSFDAWYDKGQFKSTVVTRYRKGACTNCGAMTHTAKFCCERPRKVGAKYTGKNFGKDEIVQQIELGFEAKRDRWNGYDPGEYRSRIEDWNELEDERMKRKANELAQKLAEKGPSEELIADDTKVKDEDMQTFANKDPRIKTTIRNLRLREDTPAYLYGLKEEFSNKNRDMHINPYMNPKQIYLKNDNFIRSEEYDNYMEQERLAEEAKEKVNAEINPIAMPSQAEIIFKNYKQKKELIKAKKQEELLAKYGGEEYLNPPEEFVPEEVDEYQEYDQDGNLVAAGHKKLKRTRYQEDVYVNSHASVWGSYYDDELGWGYSCCLSHDRLAQCRGEKGKREQLKENIERKKKPDSEKKRSVKEDEQT